MFGRSILMSVLSAVLTAGAVAAADSAESAREGDPAELGVKEGKRGKGAEQKSSMPGAEFKAQVEKRLAKAREKLVRLLHNKKVSDAEEKRILARFDEGAGKVRAAAERAAKDGTVTLEEAKTVREIAKDERKEMRDQFAKNDKGKKGKGKKGKGKKKRPAKG